jgi:hypothetical protein
VGSGDTGAAGAFAVLGAGYFSAMMLGAMLSRVPSDTWKPPSASSSTSATSDASSGEPAGKDTNSMVLVGANVDHITAMRTPQYYLLVRRRKRDASLVFALWPSLLVV